MRMYFNCPLTEQLLYFYCTVAELMDLQLSQMPRSIFHKYSIALATGKVQARNHRCCNTCDIKVQA